MIMNAILAATKTAMNAGQTTQDVVELPARPIIGDTIVVYDTLYHVTGFQMADGKDRSTVFGLVEL